MASVRPEYPRPQFERSAWINLNGAWQFAFDDANAGLQQRWFDGQHTLQHSIQVPFAFQTELSGIQETDFHDLVWYQRAFNLPSEWADKRVLLHFGAVDYRAWVWVNGIFAVYHQGGHTPFSVDVTQMLQAGDNVITVRVEDISTDLSQPRGKQYWEKESKSIFYTRTTGIWQTVWLEAVADVYIERVKITPDIDSGEVRLEYVVNGASDVQIAAEIIFAGKPVTVEARPATVQANLVQQTLVLSGDLHLWSPESPNLYDLTLRLSVNGSVTDEVRSYFGMRKISIENGRVLLNNKPYYMKLVLDQGYNPAGVLTFPSDDYIRRDVELTKEMGFNGARKHQKVEEPRYLYWADKLGLLVWGEMANTYEYSEQAIVRVAAEWQEAIQRDYNHPCVVVWVPLNESWGVPALFSDPRQAQHLAALYHITKSFDTTRPVVSNDGWEHARTDLLTIHDYEGQKAVLTERYATLESTLGARPAKRALYVPDYGYQGEPILVTEFGGIGYKKGAQEGWGYTSAGDDADFAARYEAVISAMYESTLIQGYCYTQLTDVEQEINGLLTYDRQPKIDLAIIRQINEAGGN